MTDSGGQLDSAEPYDGQCTCGIFFSRPFYEDEGFIRHLQDGTHEECLNIAICGPCFMGFCKHCEKTRRNNVSAWRCRCMHDFPLTFHEGAVSVLSTKLVWSDWLEMGQPSSVSLGLEET